ncbi:hypothetical protein ABK040_005443 [Willaertia magna]
MLSRKENDNTINNNDKEKQKTRLLTLLRHISPNVMHVQKVVRAATNYSLNNSNNDENTIESVGDYNVPMESEDESELLFPIKNLFYNLNKTNSNSNVLSTPPIQKEQYFTNETIKRNLEEENKKQNKWKIGYPDTDVKATLFSREMERVYTTTQRVVPKSTLIEQPKGEPPDVEKVFSNRKGGGHVCIVGPTGSGKSTIVRGILCQLSAEKALAIYSLEYPVEVNLQTHGLFHVCQIDMFQEIQGKQRPLAETANNLLKHDPDIIYFGELRHKVDFETATSIALSGVQVLSTGHASSPIDLLERLKSMNIDLKTQFRAFKCIIGVKRVPILCPHCKRQVMIYGKTDNRALKLFNMYRIVTTEKVNRRKEFPVLCMPPEPSKDKKDSCPHCINGYIRNHTIYEFLYITPESDLETLRKKHTYTTEETLLSLIMQGDVNPLYLQNSIN